MTTHIDLHVVDATGRDHPVRATLADEGDWIVRASIDGHSFTRQCGSWQSVERSLYWFRRRLHETPPAPVALAPPLPSSDADRFSKGPDMTLDFKRILVPLDFSPGAMRALDYAHAMAMKFDSSLHLVHVCEVPSLLTASMDAYAIAYTDWSQRLGEEAERELEKLRPRLAGVKVSTEVLFGNPARAIITAAATNDADLIVMGTHGHGPVMHVVMGNVAERVVRTAECPVLTVREPRAKDAKRKPAAVVSTAAALLVAGLLMRVPWLTHWCYVRSAGPTPASASPRTS